ncbi:MAG: fasciclin domain-containing protein [Chitinophagaceae bacterium]
MSNITQVVNTDKNMKTLKKGMHASDMDQLLSSSGPFTFFAPSDIAFEKLEKGYMEDLVESKNKSALTELIKSHLVSGKIFFKELKDGDKLQTVNGKELLVQVKGINVSIGDIAVQARDAKITNGVIHSLDTVLAN